MNQTPHPLAVVVARPSPMRRMVDGVRSHLSARVMVPVEAESPPRPIEFSRWYGVGRAPNDIEPHRHIVLETNLAEVTSHVYFANDGGFLSGRPLVSIRNVGNYAEALPFQERVNIQTPDRAQPPGSDVELRPTMQYAPEYAKLI